MVLSHALSSNAISPFQSVDKPQERASVEDGEVPNFILVFKVIGLAPISANLNSVCAPIQGCSSVIIYASALAAVSKNIFPPHPLLASTIALLSNHQLLITLAVSHVVGMRTCVWYELDVMIVFGIELTDGIPAAAISCCTKAVLEAFVVLFPVVSVTTVIFPPASLRATLLAVAAVAVSSFVTYLLLVLGVPLVPTRASFSLCVGTLPSLSPTAIGVAALTGATLIVVIPFVLVVASGEPAIAIPSTYALVAN